MNSSLSSAEIAPAAATIAPIIEARGLTKKFVKRLDLAGRIAAKLGSQVREEIVHAVDNVSLSVAKGEVVGLVGESGCGKSTLGRMIAGLLPPTEGKVFFKGRDRDALTGDDARAARLAVQMIFQDPYASLNPRARVESIVGEAPIVHGLTTRAKAPEYVADVLRRVGLDPTLVRRYPHQFSGGQRSRIGIARALAVNPEFLVCDEAIAALDVSIQAQVINLFMDLSKALGLTYLFISHDLGVVQHICDDIAVMYLGQIVERAPREALFVNPLHPYTWALISAVPRLGRRRRGDSRLRVTGDPPSPIDLPKACRFASRCPFAVERCRTEPPELRALASGHEVRCHLVSDDGQAPHRPAEL